MNLGQSNMEEKFVTGTEVQSKINEIMQEVQVIKKDGKIAFGSTKYNFIQDDEVVQILREKMVEKGLVMYPVASYSNIEVYGEKGKEKFLTITNQTFRIADCVSGEYIDVSTSGQGADNADKGSGKSMTNARKYALLQTFMLTGDDPDKVASDSYNDAAATKSSPGVVEPGGEGGTVIGFGTHKGKILEEFITTDKGKQWAQWYVDKGTDPAFKAIVANALENL